MKGSLLGVVFPTEELEPSTTDAPLLPLKLEKADVDEEGMAGLDDVTKLDDSEESIPSELLIASAAPSGIELGTTT